MTEIKGKALPDRYRPITFAGLWGSARVHGDILRRMVASREMPRNFLFCGPSGTGKTTVAWILARATNCLDPKDGEPCLKCDVCKMPESAFTDTVNAALARGIDTIRDKVAGMRYRPWLPIKYQFTVYDESQSLTGEAMNALLKITEPRLAAGELSHVFNIFCTTAPGKIIPTLRSRLTRFDFESGGYADVTGLLKQVLVWEEVEGCHSDIPGIAADAAQGNFRTALNALDLIITGGVVGDPAQARRQVMSISGETEEAREVAKALLSGSIDQLRKSIAIALKEKRTVEEIRMAAAGYLRVMLLSGNKTSLLFGSLVNALTRLSEPIWDLAKPENKLVARLFAAWMDLHGGK